MQEGQYMQLRGRMQEGAVYATKGAHAGGGSTCKEELTCWRCQWGHMQEGTVHARLEGAAQAKGGTCRRWKYMQKGAVHARKCMQEGYM